MIGKVLDYDKVSYIIRFTIPGYIEEAEALPMNQWDRPKVGDEVYIYQDDPTFGGLYVYHKMGDRSDKIHSMETDKLSIKLDEENNKLDINFIDSVTISIDVNNKNIKVSAIGSDVTIESDKIHLGNKNNQFAVLFEEYKSRMSDLYKALSTHTHGTPVGNSTPPLAPELLKFTNLFPSTLDNDKSNSVDIMK